MALLRAYFDASFTHPIGITSIAGYVGTEDAWAEVEAKWIDNLNLWQIGDFHLSKLPSIMGHAAADDCAVSFATIIGGSGLHGVNAALKDADWDQVSKERFGDRYPHRYHRCLEMLFDVLTAEVQLDLKGEPVAIVIDDDIKPQSAVQAIFDEYKHRKSQQLTTLTFGDRIRNRPLQCADLAAGEWRKQWLENIEFSYLQKFRRAYGSVLAKKTRGAYWSLEAERAMLDAFKKVQKEEEEKG